MAGVSRGLVSLWEHGSVTSYDTFTMPWQVGLLLWPVVGLPACLPAFAGAVAVRGSATPSDDVALYPLRLHLLACCRCCGNSVGRRSWLVWWPVVLLLVWSKLV